MSPEQIRGMPLDARTDVFSAGIILHEMLTTEKLFRGDTEFALMEKVRKAEVPAPSDFNRRVTPELDAISLKALARDVADRYQTAAQLAAALDALIGSYRFDPKELRQFMRQLFRKEYAKEVEDTQTALDTSAGGLSMSMSASHRTGQITPPVISVSAGPTVSSPAAEPEVAEPVARPAKPTRPKPSSNGGEPRGFWGALFKKRK
jgi:serine/threonine protein kinase